MKNAMVSENPRVRIIKEVRGCFGMGVQPGEIYFVSINTQGAVNVIIDECKGFRLMPDEFEWYESDAKKGGGE